MNKTMQINLGGIPFVINEDAYQILDNYLTAISRHFMETEGKDEITSDIENRLAELFQEKLNGKNILSVNDVNDAIVVMGTLEDLGVDGANQSSHSTGQYQTGRKIFRDPDDKIIGGVCSGISAYFGLGDPIWLRILFVALFFTFGTGILAYIVLLVLIPEAKSASDKLSMKGTQANVHTIAEHVQNNLNDLSKSFSGDTDQLKQNIGSSGKKIQKGCLGFVQNFFLAIGFLLPKIIKYTAIAFGIFSLFVGSIAGFGVLTALFNNDFYTYMMGEGFLKNNPLLMMGIIATFALPIIIFLLVGFKFIFKLKVPQFAFPVLSGLWILAIIISVLTISRFTGTFNNIAKVKSEKMSLAIPPSNEIIIDTEDDEQEPNSIVIGRWQVGPVTRENGKLYSHDIDVEIKRSLSNEMYYTVQAESHGTSVEEAQNIAKAIRYPVEIINGQIVLPSRFEISAPWRNQNVRMLLYVPAGVKITMTDNADNMISDLDLAPEQDSDYDSGVRQMKMTEQGLVDKDEELKNSKLKITVETDTTK